jgi:F420-non-reducing hydrogenase small subunit
MKLAVYWTGSCGGCDVSFLELGPALLDVLSKVEIVFWPALVDTKRKDLEKFPARSIDVTLVNGVIRTAENQEMVEILRKNPGSLGRMVPVPTWAGFPRWRTRSMG